METYNVNTFNQKMRYRTHSFAISVYKILNGRRLSELDLPLARQLLRSATSVAANYSSATRGRSEAEFYSKICIVVEECDEALYWLTFLSDVDVFRREQVNVIMSEASELLRIFSSIRRKLRDKRRPPS